MKSGVMFQLVMEVILITILAITLALGAGNILSSEITHEMLRHDMIHQLGNQGTVQAFHPLEELGYRFELTHEEMLELYEIRLDINSIVIFYTVGFGIVLIATIIPILSIIRLDPKKILMG